MVVACQHASVANHCLGQHSGALNPEPEVANNTKWWVVSVHGVQGNHALRGDIYICATNCAAAPTLVRQSTWTLISAGACSRGWTDCSAVTMHVACAAEPDKKILTQGSSLPDCLPSLAHGSRN